MTAYENLARDGTVTDPRVILRWRDREFGYRAEGFDRWIWDRLDSVKDELRERRD